MQPLDNYKAMIKQLKYRVPCQGAWAMGPAVCLAVLILLSSSCVFAGEAATIHLTSFIDRFYRGPLNAPMGIFVDKEHGELYVVDSGRDEILIFDTEGTPVATFGMVLGISSPLDLIVRDGRIYLSQDGNDHIDVLNYRGEPVGRIAPAGMDFSPGRMAVDRDGSIYVVNKASTECLVFDGDGRFVKSIGKGLSSLTGVAVFLDRVYLITPYDKRAVQVYDKEGTFIKAFEGLEGRGGTLGLPSAAKVDESGRLWLVDSLKGIIVYDTEGRELARTAGDGTRSGRILFPVDIDFDSQGMGYVIDKGAKRVSVFKMID